MSRQNKVNPGMYTQRGRLAQDDAAREIAKQRSVGSEHTWQPVQRDAQPRLTPEMEGADDDAPIAAPDETVVKKPAPYDLTQGSPERSRGARVTAKARSAPKTGSRKTAKAPKKSTARAKKTAAPAVRAKAKRARTTKAKAKSAKRRKT